MTHANRGKRLESFIHNCAYVEESKGELLFIRTPPEMKILKSLRNGQFVSVFSSKGPPDYIALTKNYVYIGDAKEFKGKRLPFANIHAHQADYFSRWDDMAPFAKACLFVCAKDYNDNIILPWSCIRSQWQKWSIGQGLKRGDSSVPYEFIKEHGISFRVDTMGKALLKAAEQK